MSFGEFDGEPEVLIADQAFHKSVLSGFDALARFSSVLFDEIKCGIKIPVNPTTTPHPIHHAPIKSPPTMKNPLLSSK